MMRSKSDPNDIAQHSLAAVSRALPSLVRFSAFLRSKEHPRATRFIFP